MGTIGFPRQEFLHDLKWWEVKSIIRGYNVRHHPGWEQARLVAYNAHYCMGSKDTPPTVYKWLPFSWEAPSIDLPTEDDVADVVAEMNAINAVKQESSEE